MKRIETKDATAAELRQFAAVMLGLEIAGSENRQVMLARMADAGYNADFVNIMDQTDLKPTGRTTGAFNSRPGKGGQNEVCIIIHKTDKPGGEDPVQVGVNGRLMLIPRGEKVFVPEPYVLVLDECVEHHFAEYDPDVNGGRGGLGEPRKVHAYPFSYA